MRAATKLFAGDEDVPTQRIDQARLPFALRTQFLTEEEGRLRLRLSDAIGDRAIVCPKTRASDVLRIPQAHHHLGDAVRLDRKSIDFLICDRSSCRPVCAVQLERWNDETERYHLRDEFLECALTSAGLVVLHVPSNHMLSAEKLREQIMPLLETPAARRPAVKQ